MSHATLIDATDLEHWSDRRDAQSHLPLIIRWLVRATPIGVEQLHFAAGEGVQLGGWDGIVVAREGSVYVPAGTSGWELGTTDRTKAKADADYEKRTENPGELDCENSTFVFVTSRRWQAKSAWATARREEHKWADVRAYDADDLETWLEQAPAVHLWASSLLGKRMDGAIDLEHYWREWSSVSRYPITPELIVAGRTEAAGPFQDWLKSAPAILDLQAETLQEAVAFFAAVVTQMPEAVREETNARTIVVETRETWRRLVVAGMPLVLIPLFEERALAAEAVTRGHHVLLPLGLDDPPGGQRIQLGRPQRNALREALAAMGVPEVQLDELVTLGRRSLSVLRRCLALNPALLSPGWATGPEARDQVPALLAGRWEESNAADRNVVSSLAGGRNYEEISADLTHWAHQSDPFIRRLGDTWTVVSKEEALRLLARYVRPNDLQRLEQQVLEVLASIDPQYELEKSKRFAAALHGQVLPHSEALREGLAETLARIGCLAREYSFADGSDGKPWADRIVFLLFQQVTTWQGWASLSELLPSLAEAAPEVFLDAAGGLVQGAEPIAVQLFGQEGGWLGSSPHTGLLWALERLAWSPEHLSRAALLLAALARLDPGGKLGNRPLASLQQIFLSWYSCTTAPLAQRLKVLDLIRKREPDVAWEFLKGILPGQAAIARLTATPDFRDWVTDPAPKIARGEIVQCAHAVWLRLLDDARESTARWQDLVAMADDTTPELFDQLVQRLTALRTRWTDEDSEPVRAALRDLLARHTSYPEAAWAMPAERLQRLEDLAAEFEPADLLDCHVWLFAPHPPVKVSADLEWREREETIHTIRQEAAAEIYREGGLHRLLELLPRVEDPWSLGHALGRRGITAQDEASLLSATLGAKDNPSRNLGFGFAYGATERDREWPAAVKNSPVVREGPARLKADLLLCYPFEAETWRQVAAWGPEVEHLYWTQVSFFGRGRLEGTDHPFAVDALRKHGRTVDAVHYVCMFSSRTAEILRPEEIASLLEDLAEVLQVEDLRRQDIRHDIPSLLSKVEACGQIEAERLARLEWAFLPLLEHSDYRPKVLHRALATEPEFFCELLKCLYRGGDEEPADPSPEEVNRAHAADDLLSGWRRIPGSDDLGQIDRLKLFEWTEKARKLLQERDLAEFGDLQIGQVLASSPSGVDGAWPHEAIRDLIEAVQSQELERGMCLGVYNARGITSRAVDEGGEQERAIAGTYRAYAESTRDEWPRTARLLTLIAERYDQHASDEDRSAELRQDSWT